MRFKIDADPPVRAENVRLGIDFDYTDEGTHDFALRCRNLRIPLFVRGVLENGRGEVVADFRIDLTSAELVTFYDWHESIRARVAAELRGEEAK